MEVLKWKYKQRHSQKKTLILIILKGKKANVIIELVQILHIDIQKSSSLNH